MFHQCINIDNQQYLKNHKNNIKSNSDVYEERLLKYQFETTRYGIKILEITASFLSIKREIIIKKLSLFMKNN